MILLRGGEPAVSGRVLLYEEQVTFRKKAGGARELWSVLLIMRGPRLFLFIAALQITVGLTTGHAADDKPSLEDLIAKIPQVVTGDAGINKAEQQLALQLQGFGPSSIPRLVGLLESDNEKIRTFAGYVVADLDGLTEADLDALFKARKRGDGWIPPAIARIGTPRAIAFLVDDIRSNPEPDTQVTSALAIAGEKAAPALAAFFGDQAPISNELSQTTGAIFADMGPKAKSAVPLLLEFAANQKLPMANRLGAVAALGAMGLEAAKVVPKLRELAKSDPKRFSVAVDQAILGIGTPDAADILVARLQAVWLQPVSPGWQLDVMVILRDIAELKQNGRGAGPLVVKILDGDKWDDRVCAARTLGYIGYSSASADLKRMIKSKEDWRLVYTATESLGRLKDASAVPDLRQLATDHWSPVVRKAALKAIKVIEGGEVYESRWHPSNFPLEYFEYQNLGYASSEEAKKESAKNRFVAEPGRLTPAEFDEIALAGSGEKGRLVAPRKSMPSCALRFGGGVLVGEDRGEWGGELAYLDKKGGAWVLIAENTHALHQMPFGVIATVGLAHLGMNSGCIYLITAEPRRTPSIKPWKTLPGAPMRSGILENGDLFVACYGGDVLITPAGEFRRVE